MKTKYMVGGIGSILFAISGIIYTILRYMNYYTNASLKLIINSSYDTVFQIFYVLMGLGIIIMGIQAIMIYNEEKIDLSRFAFFISLLAGLFTFLGYPLVLFPQGYRFSLFPSGGNFINFILFVISNFLTTLFFVLFSQTIRQNAENVKNQQFALKISPIILILGLVYAAFTVVIIASINALRWDSFFIPFFAMTQIIWSSFPSSSADPTIFIFLIILDYWHYPNGSVIFTYFLLWFIALVPLASVNLINGLNFFIEEGASKKQVKKFIEMEPEVERRLMEIIEDVSSTYTGVTLQSLGKKMGYKTSLVRKVIKNLEKQGKLRGDLKGNLLIFDKSGYSVSGITKPVESPAKKKKGVNVKRGGVIQGGKYVFKIKAENNTDFNITDVVFQIISYPEDSIELNGEAYREIQKIDKGGLVSPTFEFLPTKDCIVGTIHSTVTYIDHLNKPHTINVEPYTISMICGLLSPKQIDVGRFTKIMEELLDFSKAGEEVKIPYNAKLIYDKMKKVLPDHNFWFVTRPEEKILGNMFIGEFNGFAQGKYNQKEVGLKITITGEKEGHSCVGMIEVFGQDRSMLPPLISELSKKMIIWNCSNCNAPLDKEDVEKLLKNQVVECKYCGYSISKLF